MKLKVPTKQQKSAAFLELRLAREPSRQLYSRGAISPCRYLAGGGRCCRKPHRKQEAV